MQEITVYTTVVCSYCNAAKRLLTQRGYDYKEVDLTNNPELRQQLSAANSGYRTVPMIFIGKEFIGGYTELAALDKHGTLAAKVSAP
ncbi:MAG: glutathione S-transferase N-terminal domain-containing protein [Proteobacteria bacterium]|nr:glutathione S-transferase N-terminal domain-containing protein [Pseudomonadota bacterium]